MAKKRQHRPGLSSRRPTRRPTRVHARPQPKKSVPQQSAQLCLSVQATIRRFAADPSPPHTLRLAPGLVTGERRLVHLLALALGLRSFSCGSGDARRTVLRKGGAFHCPDCSAAFWDWGDCLAHCTEHRHGGARKRLQQRCAIVRSVAHDAVGARQSGAKRGRERSGWPDFPDHELMMSVQPADEELPIGKRRRRASSAAEAKQKRAASREAKRQRSQAEALVRRREAAATAIADAASAPPLDVNNRGHWLLTNLGWEPGAGLGAAEAGGVELVSAMLSAQSSRHGLGYG